MNNDEDKDLWCEAERMFPEGMVDYIEKRADYRARRRHEIIYYGKDTA